MKLRVEISRRFLGPSKKNPGDFLGVPLNYQGVFQAFHLAFLLIQRAIRAVFSERKIERSQKIYQRISQPIFWFDALQCGDM
jgi:hypothetical protein